MRITGFLLISSLFCVSCAEKKEHGGRTPLVEVDGKFIYKEELQTWLPSGISQADSALFAEQYIRSRAEEMLLDEQAANNVPNDGEVERLVENYRSALIMHIYQQQLLEQKLAGEISEQELVDFYQKNQMLFTLNQPLIKGLFIKVPLTAPQLSSVRKWYKSNTREAVDRLEKYSLQNAVKYEYFYDKWVSMGRVLDLIPLKSADPGEFMRKNRSIELKDTAFYYFLHVSDFRDKGEQEPYEEAAPRVKELVINGKQAEFMKQVKTELYQRAIEKKKIIYHY